MTKTETFGVYCAGETIEGTDLAITYIYVSTPLGKVRMTSDEAENVGRALIAAAKYDRFLIGDEERAPEVGKRYRLTPAHLKSVAAVYLDALRSGGGPTLAVADHFGVPHSTAAKWVGRARKQGTLRATSKGVAR